MNIPITDKFWQKSRFNSDFNEVSYIDNKGKSYEFIDPVKGYLKFYKSDGIDISQELLDNIYHIKTNNKREQLFIKYFSNLRLEFHFWNDQTLLFFRDRSHNGIIAEYDLKNYIFWIDYKIWSKFIYVSVISDHPQEIQQFIQTMLKHYLNLTKTTPDYWLRSSIPFMDKWNNI